MQQTKFDETYCTYSVDKMTKVSLINKLFGSFSLIVSKRSKINTYLSSYGSSVVLETFILCS